MFLSSQNYSSTIVKKIPLVYNTLLIMIMLALQVMCQQSSSGTTLVCIAPPLSVLNSYTVVMDAAPGPDSSDFSLLVDLVYNPVATQLREDTRTMRLAVNESTIDIDVCEL